jgi:threonine/homoserine/homoserine lactone efflux protein
MTDHLSAALPFALGLALSPIPLIVMIVVLSTPGARRNGPALLAGWLLAIFTLALVVLALGGSEGEDTDPSTGVRIAMGVAGLLLLGLAVKQWLARPRAGEEPTVPGWMAKIDGLGAGGSFVFGLAFSAANPKNVVLTIAGAVAINGEGGGTALRVGAVTVFVLVSAVGLLLPLGWYFVLGERAEATLARAHQWGARHGPVVLAVVLAIIGGKLLLDAIVG